MKWEGFESLKGKNYERGFNQGEGAIRTAVREVDRRVLVTEQTAS